MPTPRPRLALPPFLLSLLGLLAGAAGAQDLEIHYMNVGRGGAVLVKGPDGTTVLLEGGKSGQGEGVVVPYLQSIGIPPAAGLDYMILGHRHSDHSGGMEEVIEEGYDVHLGNFDNGSPATNSSFNSWAEEAAETTGGAPVPVPIGMQIPLGNGATMTCVARNGSVIGGASVFVDSENDRSLALLVQYGGFDWLWASDLTGGDLDEDCTERSVFSADMETPLVQAISPGGASPMISEGGIDVLHCNQHGGEASTNANWMNYSRPAVAVISTGAGQSLTDERPRKDVVESVLLAGAPCITVPAALVLQTEEGYPAGLKTSTAGFCVGNIVIATDGLATFTVSADGQVTVGPDERAAAGLPRAFPLDDVEQPPDVTPPALSGAQAVAITTSGATISWTTDETSDSVVEVGPTSSYGETATRSALVTSHGVEISGLSPDTVYHYRVASTDASGNTTVDVDRSFRTAVSTNHHPSAATILEGTLASGSVSSLSSDNNVFYVVASTTEGTRWTDWYATTILPQAPASVARVTVRVASKYSTSVNQKLFLWNWAASAWVQIQSRTIGRSEKAVTVAIDVPAPYVSPTGETRLRILGTGGSADFDASTDRVRLVVEAGGENF